MKSTLLDNIFKSSALLFVVALVMLLGGQKAQADVEVFVSIAPQKWLTEKIGGEHITTGVLIGKGQSPHTFNPTPKQVEALGRSALYFTVGFEFEEQIVDKISQGSLKLQIVNCTEGVERIAMSRHSHHDHDGDAAHHDDGDGKEDHHEEGHGDKHVKLDPHVWLSAVNLKVMATEIAKAIVVVDPENEKYYTENLNGLIKELDALDQKIATQLKPYAGETFFVFHPAFGYFAKNYGLNQEAVEVEGKSPTPKQLSHLIDEAKADGVKVIFVQPQFDPRSAEVVAKAIGGEVVPLNPLAEDVTGNLEIIASRISTALAK